MKLVLFITVFLVPLFFFGGCEERYRYPCQDPLNWGAEECKKPYCDGDQTCPEDVSSVKKKPILPGLQPMSSKPVDACNCK